MAYVTILIKGLKSDFFKNICLQYIGLNKFDFMANFYYIFINSADQVCSTKRKIIHLITVLTFGFLKLKVSGLNPDCDFFFVQI